MRPTHVVAALVVVLLGLALRAPAPRVGRVQPIAAPLTHVPGLGVDVLAQGAPPPPDALRRAVVKVVEATGTAAQKRAVEPLRAPPSMRVMDAQRLRSDVQADAVAIYAVLGPERVAAMVEARPALAEAYGELKVWREVTASP